MVSEKYGGVGLGTDVVARAVTLGAYLRTTSPEVLVEGDPGLRESSPTIAWLGNACAVAYSDERSLNEYDLYVKTIDPYTCTPFGEFFVEGLPRSVDYPRIAGRFSTASPQLDDAMISWNSRDTSTGVVDVHLQRFAAHGGRISDVGGGCAGSRAIASMAVAANSQFTLRLQNASSNQNVWAAISPYRADLPCGNCNLIPDPWRGFIFANGATNVFGESQVTLPIPASAAIVGTTLFQQWLISGTNCMGLDLSNGLRIQIQ